MKLGGPGGIGREMFGGEEIVARDDDGQAVLDHGRDGAAFFDEVPGRCGDSGVGKLQRGGDFCRRKFAESDETRLSFVALCEGVPLGVSDGAESSEGEEK